MKLWKSLGVVVGGGAIIAPIIATTSCNETTYDDNKSYTNKGHVIIYGPKGGVIDSTTGYYYKGKIYSASEMRSKNNNDNLWIGLGVTAAVLFTVIPAGYAYWKRKTNYSIFHNNNNTSDTDDMY